MPAVAVVTAGARNSSFSGNHYIQDAVPLYITTWPIVYKGQRFLQRVQLLNLIHYDSQLRSSGTELVSHTNHP